MIDAEAFAQEWVAAWNAQDLDRVLIHYTDGVELISPAAAALVPSSGGVIRGKAALRDYWATALPLIPGLHFDLLETLTTAGGVCVLYRNQGGQTVAETMLRDSDGQVTNVVVAYGAKPVA